MNTQTDLEYAITRATENIRRAEKMGLKSLAQQIRRERKAMIEKARN